MKLISDSKDITKEISIESVVSRCGVKLNKVGRDYQGYCPFHSDVKTKSLVVFTGSNSWYCFGACSRGGNSVDFVMRYYRLTYPQALDWLQTNYGALNIKRQEEEKPKLPPRKVPNEFVGYFHSLMDACGRRPYYYSRGFRDEFIDSEWWGWDGERYCIPVWEGMPGHSVCSGIRRRQSELSPDSSPKYLGLKEMNPPTVWGRWYCQVAKTILAFAGELDAARAVQDGFPAFSLVNGVGSIMRFPPQWPHLWFPNSLNLICIFDKKEETFAGRLCHQWNRHKGSMTARVFQWPPSLDIKDYCEYRDRIGLARDFEKLLKEQLNIQL